MEAIFDNPGLQLIAGKICWNLDLTYLINLAKASKKIRKFCLKPNLWLKIWFGRYLGKKHILKRKVWKLIISEVMDKNLDDSFASKIANMCHQYVPGPENHWTSNHALEKNMECPLDFMIFSNQNPQLVEFILKNEKEFGIYNWKIHTEFIFSQANPQTMKHLVPIIKTFSKKSKEIIFRLTSLKGNFECLKVLLPLMKLPLKPDSSNSNLLHTLQRNDHFFNIKQTSFHRVNFLAPLYKEPNQRNIYGNTPLLIAARNGNIDIVKALLPFCKTIGEVDQNGRTATGIAKEKGFQEIVALLNTKELSLYLEDSE